MNDNLKEYTNTRNVSKAKETRSHSKCNNII